jgi:NADH-quinone oxidoreductase subunit C
VVAEDRKDIAKLRARFGSDILAVKEKRGDVYVCVSRDVLAEVARFLKDTEDLAYDYYVECLGVDYLKWEHERDVQGRFEVVHNLYSTKNDTRLFVKVGVDDGQKVPSLKGVWLGAEYPERETWDLFGIVFEGNEQRDRFLLPEDWVGFPLRKDVGLGGEDVVFDQDTKGPAVEDVQAPHAGESFEGKTGSEDVSGR